MGIVDFFEKQISLQTLIEGGGFNCKLKPMITTATTVPFTIYLIL